MAEIAETERTGLVAVSTFSGAGGSSIGLKMAGYEVRWASEFIPAAQEVYRANHPETTLDTRDIRQVEPREILEACALDVGELDLLEGSPPCASFSTAGRRQKNWGETRPYSDTEQRVDDLFDEYVRLVDGLRPRVFTAENVSGLIKGVAKGQFKNFMRAFKACGYRVRAGLLDAQWLGVPQTRQRVFFVGVRDDLRLDPVFPSPLPYRYSIREACPWINRAVHDTSGHFSKGEVTEEPCPCITIGHRSANSVHYQVSGALEDGVYFADLAIGREWDKIAPGQQSDKFFQLVRAHPDSPSPCVTAASGHRGVAGVTHPFAKRKFSIAELRRICGFPDDFILSGSYAQQWERLGRSVPPPMMYAVASTIRDRILLAERGTD